MLLRRSACGVVFTLVLLSAAAAPQSYGPAAGPQASCIPAAALGGIAPSEPFSSGEDVVRLRKQVEEVSLTLSVTDHGRPVLGLNPDNFSVIDDNQEVRQLLGFHPVDGISIRIGLLMDWSDSVQDRLQFEQQVAEEFARQMIRMEEDEAFVLSVGTRTELTQPLTSNPEEIRAALRPSRPGRLTSLYDAIATACAGEMRKPSAHSALRRALLVISDGEDTNSMVRLQEAIQDAQRGDVAVYAITNGGHGTGESGNGYKVLRAMAAQTGGRAFVIKNEQQLAAAIAEIRNDLRNGYTLSYKPQSLDRNGHFRAIQVATHDRKYRVLVRRGYFAPQD